eukprot:symbB.v1.2.007358.t1/scaffold451.1/size378644/4
MLNQTARNRTRPWHDPQLGDKCFFYHEFRKKGISGMVKGWHGPALVVGKQGQSNLWIVFGGRCFLIAQEHCREAIGEEALYGRPEVQEALNLFKGNVGKGNTYTDLTAKDDDFKVDIDTGILDEHMETDEEMIPDEIYRANGSRVQNLPDDLLSLCSDAGWKEDCLGNPVQIAFKAYAFRVPHSQLNVNALDYRTSWVLLDGKWRLMEEDVLWKKLDDPNNLVPGGPADILISIFKTRNRKQQCLDDLPLSVKRHRVNQGHDVFLSLSKRKAQRALDKEVPYDRIPVEHRDKYKQAESKEWDSWLQYDAVEPMSLAPPGCSRDVWGILCIIVMYSSTVTISLAVNWFALPELPYWLPMAFLYNCIVVLHLWSHLQCMWTNPGIAKDFLDQDRRKVLLVDSQFAFGNLLEGLTC